MSFSLRLPRQDAGIRQEAVRLIYQLDPDKDWTLECKRWRQTRTSRQNRYYFGAVVQQIAAHLDLTLEEAHDVCKHVALGYVEVVNKATGEIISILRHSRFLDEKEFAEFVVRVQAHATQEWGVQFNDWGWG